MNDSKEVAKAEANATDEAKANATDEAKAEAEAKANATDKAEAEEEDDDDNKPVSSLCDSSSKTEHKPSEDSEDSEDSEESGQTPHEQTLLAHCSPSPGKAPTTRPRESAAKKQIIGSRKSARSQKAKKTEPSVADDEDEDDDKTNKRVIQNKDPSLFLGPNSGVPRRSAYMESPQ